MSNVFSQKLVILYIPNLPCPAFIFLFLVMLTYWKILMGQLSAQDYPATDPSVSSQMPHPLSQRKRKLNLKAHEISGLNILAESFTGDAV